MALRRRGKVLSFTRQPQSGRTAKLVKTTLSFQQPEGVRVPATLLGERLASLHTAVAALLRERLGAIDESTTTGLTAALAELQAQAIVLGGLAFHTRDELPAQLHPFLNANMAGFAGLLDEESRGDGP